MIPWFGWVYLVLLALVGLSGFALALRAGQPKVLTLVRVLSVAILGWAVVLYFRDTGVPFGFAGFLFAATLTLAQKSAEDIRQAEQMQLGRSARIGVTINGLLMLPAVAMGALAIWAGHGA